MPIFALLAPLIAALTGNVKSLVSPENQDKVQSLFDKHSTDVEAKIAEAQAQEDKSSADVIIAEQKASWLGANWRPMLMVLLMGIIFINYFVATIISFFKPIRPFPLPPELWTLIIISVPGYLGLRSVDKHLPGFIDNIGSLFKKKDS